MSKVPGKHAERKHEVRDEASVQLAMADMDARVEMIRALIPLGLEAVQDLLHDAVAQLAGPRYQHGPADRRYYRWGSERGSVYLADQKVAVQVPRVRDRHADREVRLPAYERLRSSRGGDAQLVVFMCMLISLGSSALPRHALADWPADPSINLPVCRTSNVQQSPDIISDMQGGALIVWSDFRTGIADIYAQHVLSGGSVDPSWPANGKLVCFAGFDQARPMLVSDGSGGAIIAWQDQRSGAGLDIYAHHIRADGTLDPLWPTNGVAVCTASGDQLALVGVQADNGRAIFAWEDKRSSLNADVYAQCLQIDGATAPGWPVNGVAVCTETGTQYRLAAATDGRSGVILAWQDERIVAANAQIYAHHLSSDGLLDAEVPAGGVLVCGATGIQSGPRIISDESSGALIAWVDERAGSTNKNIYAQHVLPAGDIDPAWPTDGQIVCDAPNNQLSATLIGDGVHGAIVTWGDQRAAEDGIYAQRIRADGTADPRWPVNGLSICTASGFQGLPAIVSDGNSGAILAWIDFRSSPTANDLYAQHVLEQGAVDAAWMVDGVALSTAYGTQANPKLIPDYKGGAIGSWQDTRSPSFSYDIYAQRILASGQLGGATVGVAPSASHGLQLTMLRNPILSHSLECRVGLVSSSPASLAVFDVLGRLIAARQLEPTGAAVQEVQVAVENSLPSGMYLVRLQQGSRTCMARAVLMR